MNATELARDVVATLIQGGVSDLVVAPGSRNAPLSFAAYDAAAAGLIRLHTRIDERTAGFLALGLTRNGCRTAVICTSGTAVANLYPAVARGRSFRGPDRPGHGRSARPVAFHGGEPDHRSEPDPGRAGPHRFRRASAIRSCSSTSGSPADATSTSISTSRCYRPTGGRSPRSPPTLGRPGSRPSTTARSRSARAPWWWRVPTPGSRHAGSPRRPGGRCWPSRAAARAPAPTPCVAIGCCSAASSPPRSTGSWCSAGRPCPAR